MDKPTRVTPLLTEEKYLGATPSEEEYSAGLSCARLEEQYPVGASRKK